MRRVFNPQRVSSWDKAVTFYFLVMNHVIYSWPILRRLMANAAHRVTCMMTFSLSVEIQIDSVLLWSPPFSIPLLREPGRSRDVFWRHQNSWLESVCWHCSRSLALHCICSHSDDDFLLGPYLEVTYCAMNPVKTIIHVCRDALPSSSRRTESFALI